MRNKLLVLALVLVTQAISNCARSSVIKSEAPANTGGDGGQTYSGKRNMDFVRLRPGGACSDGNIYDRRILFDPSLKKYFLTRSNCADIAPIAIPASDIVAKIPSDDTSIPAAFTYQGSLFHPGHGRETFGQPQRTEASRSPSGTAAAHGTLIGAAAGRAAGPSVGDSTDRSAEFR